MNSDQCKHYRNHSLAHERVKWRRTGGKCGFRQASYVVQLNDKSHCRSMYTTLLEKRIVYRKPLARENGGVAKDTLYRMGSRAVASEAN